MVYRNPLIVDHVLISTPLMLALQELPTLGIPAISPSISGEMKALDEGHHGQISTL
jgi:hypothetical protein